MDGRTKCKQPHRFKVGATLHSVAYDLATRLHGLPVLAANTQTDGSKIHLNNRNTSNCCCNEFVS